MRNLMFKLVVFSLVLLLIGILALQIARPNLTVQAQTKPAVLSTCNLDFSATVRRGVSANTTLAGQLSFDLATDGSITGNLTEKDGTQIAVAGQVIGRAISVAFQIKPFDLSKGDKGSYIFGSGVAFDPITGNDCGGVMGGTFSGPQDGDGGDWGGEQKPDYAQLSGGTSK